MVRSRSGLEAYRAVDFVRVESNEHFLADDEGRRRAALVLPDKFADVLAIFSDIAVFKRRASLREVCLDPGAGRSSGLGIQNDLLVIQHALLDVLDFDAECSRFLQHL
jgi:hypothetical protein